MAAEVTVLPVAPQDFWPLVAAAGLVALTLVILFALRTTAGSYRRPVWEDLPEGWGGVAIFLGLVWIGLFGLTLIAAYLGVWQMIHPAPGEAGQTGLGLGALLAALLGAPFVILGTWLKYQTVRFQKEGHMTDRISKAVEQLGAEKTVKVRGKDAEGREITVEETKPNIEVRIGAILSLERIAQDSTIHDKGRDHVRVMEILCAYVRENSNARKPVDFPLPDWEPLRLEATDEERAAHQKWQAVRFPVGFGAPLVRDWARSLSGPRADVVLAIRVIGRRTAKQRLVEAAWPDPPNEGTVWLFDLPLPKDSATSSPSVRVSYNPENPRSYQRSWVSSSERYSGYRLDLRGSNLQGIDLTSKGLNASAMDLGGARMDGVRLEGAKLVRIRMTGADLRYSRLKGAILSSARLEGAELLEAQIEGAFLKNAKMTGALLWHASLDGADLSEAIIEGAALGRSSMERADLSKANMTAAEFEDAHLEGADLRKAWMEATFLSGVRMHGTLAVATAEVRGSAIAKIDLSKLMFSSLQIEAMFGDASVTLPAGMPRPKHWPSWKLGPYGKSGFHAQWVKWRADPAGYRPPPPPDAAPG